MSIVAVNHYLYVYFVLMSFTSCLAICSVKNCTASAKYIYYKNPIPRETFSSCFCSCLRIRRNSDRNCLTNFESVKAKQLMCAMRKIKEKDLLKIKSFSSSVLDSVKVKDSSTRQAGQSKGNSNVILRRHLSNLAEQSQSFEFLPSEQHVIKQMKNRFLQTNQYYDAVFVLGAMGSGKTKVINEEFRSHKVFGQYAYVDTDEIMEQLDGFHEDAVDKFYPNARRIAIYLTDWLLEQKLSFVAEGTCVKFKELENYMLRLKEKGYSIKVFKVPVSPLDIVLQRTKRRRGRKIPESIVKSIYLNSQYGLDCLLHRNKDRFLFKEIN